MRRALVLLTVTAVVVLSVSGTAFAVGWTTPVPLAPAGGTGPAGSFAQDAVSVVNQAGAQAIVWDVRQDTGDGTPCIYSEATTRVPGGDWAPTTQLGCSPVIKIGPDGTAIAMWEEVANGTSSLMAATAQAGSSFGNAVVVDSSTMSHLPRVAAVDSAGRVTVAWVEYTGSTHQIIARSLGSGGSWGSRETVDAAAGALSVPGINIAAGPHGDVVIAATGAPAAGVSGFYAYVRLLGQAWSPKRTLLESTSAPGLATTLPRVAIDPQDRATIAAAIFTTANKYEVVAWPRAADSTTFGAIQSVPGSQGVDAFSPPGLAVDSNGIAQMAFFYSQPFNTFRVRTASRSPGNTTWTGSNPQTIGPDPCGTSGLPSPSPDVAFDAFNTATVSFQCSDGPHIMTRPSNSNTFGAFVTPAGAVAPQIVSDPNGYLIATWITNGITYTSVYDAVNPSVDQFDPPPNAVAGQAANFTITGSDVWGPVTYNVDFGDGSPAATGRVTAGRPIGVLARATVASTVSHTYSTPGSYTATITVTDNAANGVTTTRAVAVAPIPTQSQTPVPLPPVPGLPAPIAGTTVNVLPVVQPVFVKEPGQSKFVPLTQPSQIRVGSIIDTRKGRVRITIDNGRGGLDTADFYQGVFKLLQQKPPSALATMQLFGGRFKGCAKAPRVKISANRKTRSVRHLWGSGKGKFRTAGRFSSATIRGTQWLTDDRCDGTLVRVKQGKVAVRDFVKKKTVIVKAGKRYFARPRAKR